MRTPIITAAVGLALLAIASALVLGACSAGEVSRSAAGASEPDSAVAGSQPVGVNVCITNESSAPINVDFTVYRTKRGDRTLASGAVACAEGMTTPDKWDVQGYINQGDPDQLVFGVDWPWVADPVIEVADTDKNSPNYGLGICPDGSGWAVNDSRTMAVPALQVEARRNPDDEWKQFALVVRDGDGSTQGTKTCQ